ncbi:TetR family transcriptional regulator (plasmid) [Streptomyces sp. BI20]|uniref:TetR family transcriptional regulator n=1 Tax=Streptomyces sp. BI20 TaxID=3403460 RepID=UPI003C7925F6
MDDTGRQSRPEPDRATTPGPRRVPPSGRAPEGTLTAGLARLARLVRVTGRRNPSRAEAERTRRRILDAACELIAREGPAAAAPARLARAAGVRRAVLRRYHPTPESLADAVCARARDPFAEFVRRAWETGTPPLRTLVELTARQTRAVGEDPAVRAALRIAAERATRPDAAGGDPYRAWTVEVLRLLGEARERGDLPARATGPAVEDLVPGLFRALGAVASRELPPAEARGRAEACRLPLLAALPKPGRGPRARTGFGANGGDGVSVIMG